MSDRDYEHIPGSEYMSDADRSYFETFGEAIDDQAELVVEQVTGEKNIDSQELERMINEVLDDLVNDDGKYLVDGALLKCSMQTDAKQTLTYNGEEVISEPIEENIKEMASLHVTDKKRVTFNGYTPATVIDSKGGMRDEKEKWNIGGFGNCLFIQNGTAIEDIANMLLVSLLVKGKHTKIQEIEGKIKKAIEEGKGTCHCFMSLNPEWENLPIEYNFATGIFEYSWKDALNEASAGIDYYMSGEKVYQNFNGIEGINMMSMLFCKRGGIISAEESGQSDIVEPILVLDGWLKLYDRPTVCGAGRSVTRHQEAAAYDWAMPEDLHDENGNKSENWFATLSPAHDEIVKKGVFIVEKTSNNLYIDGEGRYWVAVGPNVVNPEHCTDKTDKSIDSSEMYYGTKLDIVVKSKDGKIYYIPAVNGDTKEHSYPDGLYQTGESFDINRITDLDSAGNTVEFTGYDIATKIYDNGDEKCSINITNDYELIEIIVYDGVYNYE